MPTQTYNAAKLLGRLTFDPSRAGEPAPIFTSAGRLHHAGEPDARRHVTATDADGDALTYAIAGGADAARFTINAADRRAALPDRAELRGPADAGANNVYDLTVSASATAAGRGHQAVAVTVTDVSRPTQPPTIAADRRADHQRGRGGPVQINLLAGASDPEGDPITVLSPDHRHLVERRRAPSPSRSPRPAF